MDGEKLAAKIKTENGRKAAKGGFAEERKIAERIENWRSDAEARQWLKKMGADAESIASVSAERIGGKGGKADILVSVSFNNGDPPARAGISVKKVSKKRSGGNQIDRRSVQKYAQCLNLSPDVTEALSEFVGEFGSRKYMEQIDGSKRDAVVQFIEDEGNLTRLVEFVARGSGETAADYILVSQRYVEGGKECWNARLLSMDEAFQFLKGDGLVHFPSRKDGTRQGLRIGRMTAQRKGGKPDPTSLQFKINPVKMIEWLDETENSC